MSTSEATNTINRTLPKRRLHNRLRTWSGRVLLGLGMALLLLASIGATYQAIATARDTRAFPPPGQWVDVGGYKLHLFCLGEGTPTVILESGQANSLSVWAWVQPAVAKITRVCAYDRAGVGWSEASPQPRDARHLAAELHTLLTNAAITAPYVLVGHSFGGLVTRIYAADYPTQVAGLVWLDVEHPEQWTRTPEGRAQYAQIDKLSRIGPWFARLGLVRFSNYFPQDQDLPPSAAAAYKAWVDTTRFMQINQAEFQGQLASAAQFQAAGSLGTLPLIVLTATDHGDPPATAAARQAEWQTMQSELAALSSASVHQIIQGATHGSLLVKQTDAQVSSAAIGEMIAALRTGTPLQ